MSDFFELQEVALKRSRQLIFLTVVVVVCVLLSIELVFGFILGQPKSGDWTIHSFFNWLTTPPAWWIALFTLLIMFAGAIFRGGLFSKKLSLEIQEKLGARRIELDSQVIEERRLINIVEEMSIASGLPIPFLFVQDHEEQINAFVAGIDPQFTTLTVTRGALDQLNRDELQGVVAHEFSHLLHADTLVNTRLFAIVSGLAGISYVGYKLIQFSSLGSRNRRTVPYTVLFALIFIAIGSLGSLAAQILKAAISRQREYLADSAAVQFTRNKSGIIGALQKISQMPLQFRFGSNSMAREVSYMCISPTTQFWTDTLLATHPPIQKRIEVLGGINNSATVEEAQQSESVSLTQKSSEEGSHFTTSMEFIDPVEQVGVMGAGQLQVAREFLSALGPLTRTALQSSSSVPALLIAQAMMQDSSSAAEKIVQRRAPSLYNEVKKILVEIEPFGAEARLPLLELMTPALQKIPQNELKSLFELIKEMAEADGRISSFELALLVTLWKRVEGFEATKRNLTLAETRNEAGIILASILHSNQISVPPPDELKHRLETQLGVELNWRRGRSLQEYLDSFLKIASLTPMEQKKMLKASITAITDDGEVTATELHLIRAIASALGLPLPPLLS